MKGTLIRALRWMLSKLEGPICEECPHPIADHYKPSPFKDGTCQWASCRCFRVAHNIRMIRGLE